MRILIVTEMWPPHSGSFVVEQIKSLAPFISITVVVLVPQPPNLGRYQWLRSPLLAMPAGPSLLPELGENIPIHYLRYRTIPELGKYLNSWQAWRVLRRFLQQQRERFDLLHAHFAFLVGFAAARAGRRFNTPVVVTTHGSDINYYSHRTPKNLFAAWFTIWGLRHAMAVTAVCEDLKNKVAALKIPPERIKIVPAGIRETIFYPRGEKPALRRQLQLAENGNLFLFVGNLIPVKGLDYLLNALAQICKKLPEVRLAILGSGELETSLKRLADTLRIAQSIVWVGRKPHAEIPIWMSAADFLVLPSQSEGYPMVVLEALACGTPVIASRVGGIPEILVSTAFGIMVPPRDCEALAQAMLEALARQWDKKKLVDYARANTWAERAQRFLHVYHDVLDTQAKRTGLNNR